MEPLLLFPDPPPPPLSQALDLGGYPWKAVDTATVAERFEPEDGWSGAVVSAEQDPEAAFALCRALRKRDLPLEPLLLVIPPASIGDLELRDDLFDDFCSGPGRGAGLEAGRRHVCWRTGGGGRPELSGGGPLRRSLETYQ